MKKTTAKDLSAEQQEELPLSSVLAHAVFPGRSSLYCHEVAHVTRTTPQHIRNLCMNGTIRGAFSISGRANEVKTGFWRIPVSAYDAWIVDNSNLAGGRS